MWPEKDMTKYVIEDDHPLPALAQPRGRKETYPWSSTEVGQSFYVPGKTVKQMHSSASKAKSRTGRTFAVRAEGDGVRVWRCD